MVLNISMLKTFILFIGSSHFPATASQAQRFTDMAMSAILARLLMVKRLSKTNPRSRAAEHGRSTHLVRPSRVLSVYLGVATGLGSYLGGSQGQALSLPPQGHPKGTEVVLRMDKLYYTNPPTPPACRCPFLIYVFDRCLSLLHHVGYI